MPGQLTQLRQLIADNPGQTVRLLRVEQLVTERLNVLQRGIGMYQSDPDKTRVLQSSRPGPLTDEGKQFMDAIRAQIGEMQETERALLKRRDSASRRSARTALATTAVALGLGLMLVTMVIWLFTSNMAMRQRATDVVHAERERFRTTLTSIGDAVIVTDAQGRITLLNPVARALTRWGEEAIGRPLEEVFRIVNEGTREAVQSPVSKVIRIGGVVGLANHTVLIARDDTEVPIDDSGAPIRDSRGRIVGVVLVFRDVTERRRTEMATEEADRRKDEFLAMLAHELRNPLAPIRNAAHTLGLLGGSDARLRWVAEVIERQVGLMTRLVDDLLDVSRITSGKITLRRAPVPVQEVVEQAVEMARPVAEGRKQTLEVEVAEDAGWVDGDQARLVQVVGNLLDNAIKYTDEGGRIVIAARRDGGDATIAVRDTGAGIPVELLPRVFDLFTQADRSLERRQGGLGLGLTLVRRLVEMHGGAVHVASDGLGLGSEFTIRLPGVDAGDGAVEAASPPPLGASDPSAARSILVVDDETDSTDSLAMFLRLRGHEVRTAHDGPSALEEVARHPPDVVFLDLGLPGMSGYDVARQIRAQPQTRDLRLVALTGYGTEADRAKSRAAGFDVHLAKPVDPPALDALLARWA
jgi:PAS domain S-box-containing protein